MREATWIFDTQLTFIWKLNDDDELTPMSDEERKRMNAKIIKTALEQFGVDDVIVKNIQIFEREVADD